MSECEQPALTCAECAAGPFKRPQDVGVHRRWAHSIPGLDFNPEAKREHRRAYMREYARQRRAPSTLHARIAALEAERDAARAEAGRLREALLALREWLDACWEPDDAYYGFRSRVDEIDAALAASEQQP